jgi:hypothetical protein
MHFHETRAAIAATLTGLVLATGVGAVATPPPPPPPGVTATATQQVDAVTGVPLNPTFDGPDGR